MIGTADFKSLQTIGHQIVTDYCDINKRKNEFQFICDNNCSIIAWITNEALQQSFTQSSHLHKRINNLFLQVEELMVNARGCVIHTQVTAQPAFADLLESFGFDSSEMDITLYPVFQTPVHQELHNFSVKLKPKSPNTNTIKESPTVTPSRIPYCLIDTQTGLLLESNPAFQELIGKNEEMLSKSRCEELGLCDLLLLAMLNTDRRCFFPSQFTSGKHSIHWVISESVTLHQRSCIKIWCPVHTFEVCNPEYKTDDITKAWLKNWKNKPSKVLICDDNELLLDTCSSIMNWVEIDYSIACNGKEALNLLENESFDVVLLDLNMPRLNGFDTARIIKQSNKKYSNTPLIAMTATPIQGLDSGRQLKHFDAILKKPFDIEDIRQATMRAFREAKKNTPQIQIDSNSENQTQSIHKTADYAVTSFLVRFREQKTQLEAFRTSILDSLQELEKESLQFHIERNVEDFMNLIQRAQSMSKSVGATKLNLAIKQIWTIYEKTSPSEREYLFEQFQHTLTEAQIFYNHVNWHLFITKKQKTKIHIVA